MAQTLAELELRFDGPIPAHLKPLPAGPSTEQLRNQIANAESLVGEFEANADRCAASEQPEKAARCLREAVEYRGRANNLRTKLAVIEAAQVPVLALAAE